MRHRRLLPPAAPGADDDATVPPAAARPSQDAQDRDRICSARAGARLPLPDNVRVERFIPYADLLPHVDALVTNGGYGSIQLALAHGVPVVAFGGTEDKPEIANRVEWSGVGRGVRRRRATPAALFRLVRQVLDEPRFRRRAREVQAQIAAVDARARAGDALERLVPATVRTALAA